MYGEIDSKQGLTNSQVRHRIEQGLSNAQSGIPTKSIRQIISSNVLTLFNFINLVLALLVVCVRSYRNALFLGVVVSNLFIGIIQEIRAKRTIDKLSLISAPKAVVIRDGKQQEIPVKELVLDDIMILKRGDQICADAVVIEGCCQVNESMLTGESDPIEKKENSKVFSGSFVISGTAVAVVTAVGNESYANKIANGAKYMKKPNSEIMDSLQFIIKWISICIIPIGFILFYKQIFIVGQSMQNAVVSTVAALIGMIPEGLVLLTSIVLAVSVVRLAKARALVQELFCIETLARVDILCLDKTGTLTEGSMKLAGIIPLLDEKAGTERIIGMIAKELQDGTPVMQALAEEYEGAEHDESAVIVEKSFFSSERKWSMLHMEKEGVFLMGAAEFMMSSVPETLEKQIFEYSSKGKRVILVAKADNVDFARDSVTPYALLLFTDVLRKNTRETLDFFKKEGVTLKVISGDNPVTASHVAVNAGVAEGEKYIDASNLHSFLEIEQAAREYTVFGRVTPEQKQLLMKALKEQGHTVAMTGDGVNDVLALKEADCSIAMQSGCEAARNIAQLVLLDSDFASMPAIVKEGRRAINNIKRSASLFLVKTIYACILAVLFVFLNEPYPFVPIQLTLISSLTIGIPSFLLALEPNYERVEGKFLQKVFTASFPGGLMIVTNIICAIFFIWFVHGTQEQYRTIATLATTMAAFIILFKICIPFNHWRMLMYVSLVGLFAVVILLLPQVFFITELRPSMFAFLGILCGINVGMYSLYHACAGFVIAYRKKKRKG